MRLGRSSLWATAVAAVGLGCVGNSHIDSELFVGGASSEPIISGTPASSYPEAALVDMGGYACSGALIAPRVVLTAGHCVQGMTQWKVTLPFASKQSARATGATVYDYTDTGDYVNPRQHDIGLIFLGTGLTLPRWPVVARAKVADGSRAIDLGRIQDGELSNDALFQSQPIALKDATSEGFPYDYYATEVIESGDSGGPVISLSSSPHEIVAVNSGGGNGTEVLARTDLLYTWIDEQVRAHGGWGTDGSGSSSGGGSSSSSGGASSGGASSSSSSGGSSGCVSEVEPNDSYRRANPLGASACGALGTRDVIDWYTWSIDGSTPYAVTLAASGDAHLFMWKLVDGRYHKVANTTLTSLEHTATGAGSYVVAVVSFSASVQSYTLTLSGGGPPGGSSGASGSSSGGSAITDGAALYASRCARCHGPLAKSRVRGAAADRILAAHGGMVTSAEAAAIAGAL